MSDWVKSWDRWTWAMAVVLGVVGLLALNHVFGAETLRTWIEAVYGAA